MINKLLRFARKPRHERVRAVRQRLRKLSSLPFHFGKANFAYTFLGCHPDAHAHFGRHDEFEDLFRSFTAHNRSNNAGDVARLWSLILNIKQVLDEKILGDFAELGVWRGNTAAVLAHYAAAAGRRLFLFDTFEGFDRRDITGIDVGKSVVFGDTSLALVKEVIGAPAAACEFVKGYFPATVTDEHRGRRFAVVNLDCDLYEPMKAGLEFFYPRMPKGGLLLLHDYSSLFWDGAKKAVDEFCLRSGEHLILLPDKSGSAVIRKSVGRGVADSVPEP